MKSFNQLDRDASLPLLADDILEFHAARILLLIKHCGRSNRIVGLTKMAKLDFFVRYPRFFAQMCAHLGKLPSLPTQQPAQPESPMVRYRYGPWDRRYYHILAYLEAKQLIDITKQGKGFRISLTKAGIRLAKNLSGNDAFRDLVNDMAAVSEVLGGMQGTRLKNLIYEVFDQEVAQLDMQEVIKP